METDIGSGGDFAFAIRAIAHEGGARRIQNLLGILPEAHHSADVQVSPKQRPTRISVRIELQADYLAGVWGQTSTTRCSTLLEA